MTKDFVPLEFIEDQFADWELSDTWLDFVFDMWVKHGYWI